MQKQEYTRGKLQRLRFTVGAVWLFGAMLLCATAPDPVVALELRGVVESVAPKVQSLQIIDSNSGQSIVVALSKDVVFVNARSLLDIQVNDIVIVEMQPGQRATRLVRDVVAVGPEKMIGVDELAALLRGTVPYSLVDARPKFSFDEGHIPTAISIYVEDLSTHRQRLPADKDQLIVFYCPGST